jgi:Flp pilus assembly protein TadB
MTRQREPMEELAKEIVYQEVSSGGSMSKYMIAFLVLMIAWCFGWILFHVTSGLIHILLVAAVVSLILHFVRARHGEADLRIRS